MVSITSYSFSTLINEFIHIICDQCLGVYSLSLNECAWTHFPLSILLSKVIILDIKYGLGIRDEVEP